MTRLGSGDVREIGATLPDYDRQLQSKTGCTLKTLASRAADGHLPAGDLRFEDTSVAVVPLTSGDGVISGFAPAVAAILAHLGFDAFVASRTDAAGLSEACEQGADMVFMADDHCFSAINLATRRVADNSAATGRGFAVALDLMAGGLSDKPVLVLGCGPVGASAARQLTALGARVGLFDIVAVKARRLAANLACCSQQQVAAIDNFDHAVANYDLILDATPAADVVMKVHVTPRTMIAAPGVPCGLHLDALPMLDGRLIHDPLHIGVATMAIEAWLPGVEP